MYSGGTISAWLAAFAKPGQIRAAVCEDAPLFASEVDPSTGQPIRQAIGPMFRLWSKWLGDQWSIGNWEGMQKAAPRRLEVITAWLDRATTDFRMRTSPSARPPRKAGSDSTSNTVYAGTGEPNICRSGCIAGVGLYKSKDGGDHWTGPLGAQSFSGRGIGSIQVKPGDSSTVFVGSGAQGSLA